MDASPDPDLELEREQVRRDARRQLLAILIAVGVMAVAGVVALIVSGGGDDELDTDDTAPDVTAPPGDGSEDTSPGGETPDLDDAYPELDTAHPLVGRTELEVRRTYPVVRVVWRDGEPLMVTADLVHGRLNLALVDGEVVGAAAEGCGESNDAAPSWVQQACSPSELDGPDTFGTLVEGEGGTLVLEPGSGVDRYFEGLLIAPRDEPPLLLDAAGVPLAQGDLTAGQFVRVWVGGPCAESFPVQCELDAVLVER